MIYKSRVFHFLILFRKGAPYETDTEFFFKCASEDIFEHYVLRMDDEDIQVCEEK